jgi:hypothetical protein
VTWEWTITEDWKTPAPGEEWHTEKNYADACHAAGDRIGGRKDCLWRFVQTEHGTIIDHGSHTRFGLVREKGGE